MKNKVLKTVFAVFIVCAVIFIINFYTDDNTFQTVVTQIHKDCFIENLDDNMQSIYCYPNGDEAQKKYIVEEWEDVVKYATNGKDVVAIHCIYNNFFENEKEQFIVFNTVTEEKFTFDKQEDFLKYCKEEQIVLSEWKTEGC